MGGLHEQFENIFYSTALQVGNQYSVQHVDFQNIFLQKASDPIVDTYRLVCAMLESDCLVIKLHTKHFKNSKRMIIDNWMHCQDEGQRVQI